MPAKKRGLGKGLDALLGPYAGADISSALQDNQLRHLPVDLIERGKYQPRLEINQDALEELASSIRAQGVVQPIVVRPISASNKYEIVAGERRWRASQLAGLHEIPALVREFSDQAAMCVALIENIQRENLNPIDEARALSRLIKEFEMTHDAAAEAVGRSRPTVTNFLRLLELHANVQKMLETGKLEMGHARAILALPIEQQPEVANKIIKQGLSVRESERLIRRLTSNATTKKTKSRSLDPNIRRLQEELSEKLGASVAIQHTASGKGMVQIRYNSPDELNGILSKIK